MSLSLLSACVYRKYLKTFELVLQKPILTTIRSDGRLGDLAKKR